MKQIWQCGHRQLALSRPLIMGIVNATPDSFFSESRMDSSERAIAHARQLLAEGADILDIGGESTRPGAAAVSIEEETQRVVPVITALRKEFPGCFISVDTRHTEVACTALAAGADIINDVNACFAEAGMIELIAATGAGYVLMHSRGDATTMDSMTHYTHVIQEVTGALLVAREAMVQRGVKPAQIMLDAGFGFAKTHADSLKLLGATAHFAALGPYLIAASRKRFIGEITQQSQPEDRLAGSLGAALYGASQGAHVIRVHDVRATVDALAVFNAAKDSVHA